MLRLVSMPGPPPTSCRTCRRRRKKCDLSKPCCDRCARDGHECLGYEKHKPRVKLRYDYLDAPISSQQWPFFTTIPINGSTEKLLDHLPGGWPADLQDSTGASPGGTITPSVPRGTDRYRAGENPTKDKDVVGRGDPLRDYDHLWPQDPSQLVLHSRSQTRRSAFTKQSSSTEPTGSNIDVTRLIKAIPRFLSPTIDRTQNSRGEHSMHLLMINEYLSQRLDLWFIPPAQGESDVLTRGLTGATKTMLVLCFEARIFRSFGHNLGTCGSTSEPYIGWIDRFEQSIIVNSPSNLPPDEIRDCVSAHIELVRLKFHLVNSASGYTALRSVLPKLLRLAAADPGLMIQEPNGSLVISLPRMLYALRPELIRFSYFDTVSSFLLGVPPLVEYGYDSEYDMNPECESRGHEWVHGTPAVLLQVIAQVNSWRASSRVRLDHWHTLEQRVLSWTSRYAMLNDSAIAESATCLRAAVHEGWKHVVLIYIYMGIRGVSSHDSRVQASVDRIFEIAEVVGSSQSGVHMFSHYVVAGLAARLESQRIAVYEKLLSFTDGRVWLFSGPEFGFLLRRFWHGAGAGGAAVTWDDYVRAMSASVFKSV
ncbi:hypothetical protein RHS04_00779 [Rhizoctonia solani]|uniref:Zn(2)-C6 fungal-type domain-containing protein n=1 Tax=Rhizoctonia solani TaxID=456999 RepID=A0A8H7HH05_9AGAM|nr:hypothetical protein RHS04_00779 [Rhizoctonia solani]